MSKQVIVIGLGQFGTSLTRALAQRGVDVLAIDKNEEKVEAVAPFAARAMAFDATDENDLAAVEPARRDLSVCAIGDDSREGSIITTALLRQLGAPLIVARATDLLHERILRLVGAQEVVNPERAFGERVAARMAYEGIIDEIPLGGDLFITEVRTPPFIAGRTLVDLALPRRFGVNVVAIRRQAADGHSEVLMPRADVPLDPNDILVLVARPGVVSDMLARS